MTIELTTASTGFTTGNDLSCLQTVKRTEGSRHLAFECLKNISVCMKVKRSRDGTAPALPAGHDSMTSWELFHLASVPEAPEPLSEPGTPWRMGRSTPVLYQCMEQHAGPVTVHSLLSAHWKLRCRKHRASPPITRKAQGSNEWMLSRQGGKDAVSLFQSTSKIWLPGRALCICMYCVQHLQEQLLKVLPTSITLPSFSLGCLEPGR